MSQTSESEGLASIATLRQQVRTAVARIGVLRTANEPAEHVALKAFQELDTAHEELRTAEEHLHLQVDAIAAGRAALDVERERYRELFDAAPDPYLLTDMDGRVLEANQRACRLLNIESAFLSGKPLAAFVGAEDRDEFRAKLGALLCEPTVTSFELRLQPRYSLTPAWAAVSACRAMGPNGRPSAIRWLLRDITTAKADDRNHLEQRLAVEHKLHERTEELRSTRQLLEHSLAREQQANARAAAAVYRHETLLAVIAHDLWTRLSSLSGWLQVIRRNQGTTGNSARALASMSRGLRELTRMTSDLVGRSRQAEAFFRLNRASVLLSDLVVQVVESFRETASHKGVLLTLHVSDGVPPIMGDAHRLQQVLNNLLDNAVKFTGKDGAIHLTLTAQPKHIEIVIRDTGCGIDATFLPHVFDAFAAGGAESRHAAGPGFGLHIARCLIELHGGSIRAESAGLGSGARFVIKLPR